MLKLGNRPAAGIGLLSGYRPRAPRHLLQRSALGRGRRLLHLRPKADATEGKEIERCVRKSLLCFVLGREHFALSLLHGSADVGAAPEGTNLVCDVVFWYM